MNRENGERAKKIVREMEDNRRHERSNVDLRSCEMNYYHEKVRRMITWNGEREFDALDCRSMLSLPSFASGCNVIERRQNRREKGIGR